MLFLYICIAFSILLYFCYTYFRYTFYIEKYKYDIVKNITGKIIDYKIGYYIVKFQYWEKKYLYFCQDKKVILFFKKQNAYIFDTKEKAEEVLNDIIKNPDTYIEK